MAYFRVISFLTFDTCQKPQGFVLKNIKTTVEKNALRQGTT